MGGPFNQNVPSDLSALDGVLDMDEEEHSFNNENDKSRAKNGEQSFIAINTNAQSLCPKINSLVDCFEEVGADVGIVMESWLFDGRGLNEDDQNFVLGTGLGMLYRNCPTNTLGFSNGGVAIVYRS